MSEYHYRGVQNNGHYRWHSSILPSAFLDPYGNVLTTVVGYTASDGVTQDFVRCNRDGSVALGTAGPGPKLYDPGRINSPWEQEIPH